MAGSEPTGGLADAPRGFLLGLSLAQLISWGSSFYLFGLLVQPIEATLQISRAQSSLGFSLMLLAEGVGALPVGRLIDRGHARAVMSGGSVMVGLFLLLHTQVNSLAAYYAVWLCLGMALSCVLYTPVFAVVTRRFPLEFRRAIITITFLGGLASTVFIPLIQWLIGAVGWRGMLVALAGLQLFICLPLHWHCLKGEPAAAAHPASHVHASPPMRLRALLGSPVFLLIAVFSTLGMAVTAAIPAHLVPLLTELRLPGEAVVLVPAGIGVVQVCGRVLLFRLEGRFDVHRVNLMIVLLMPLSLLLLGILMLAGPAAGQPGPWVMGLALAFTCLYGLANGMLTIVKGTAIAQYVSRQQVASLNGAIGLPQAIGRALSPVVVGALWGLTHDYTWGVLALLAGSVLCCAAFAAAQVLARRGAGTAPP